MKHDEIAYICRQFIALKFGILEKDILLDPWDRVIFDFAKSRANKHTTPEEIRDQFSRLIPEIKNKQDDGFQEAMQRHHDYFCHRHNRGQIVHIHDKLNYEYAMRREKKKEVKPLSGFENFKDSLFWFWEVLSSPW